MFVLTKTVYISREAEPSPSVFVATDGGGFNGHLWRFPAAFVGSKTGYFSKEGNIKL